MNRVLLIIGGILVGLLAALFTIPAFVDWTRYRGMFEEEASRLIGREVRVDGRVNLRLLPSPTVSFEKVRVSDTQAAVGEPLFKADAFTVWLAVSPLIGGSFEATEIELRKPAVALVLDDKGGGNWTSLVQSPATSRFAPARVALDRVRVTNGSIAVYGAGGEERSRIEHVNGDLSAQAIEGPYRIAAAFSTGGIPREIRLSTAKAEADGNIRLKGTVRSPQSGTSFTLDGVLADLFRQPRLDGDLTAKLPLPSAGPTAGAGATKGREAGETSYDFRARVKADTSGAELTEIALSFEQDGKPQLATGSAQIAWQRQFAAKVEMSSRWLDLDRIGGRDAGAPLSDVLVRLASGLDAAMPTTGTSVARLTLDQATLGGDVVSGLGVGLERRGGELWLQLTGAMPGGSRIAANGQISGQSADALFTGDVNLRGANIVRFAAWAARNTPLQDVKQEGPFLVSGRLAIGARRVAGRDLVVQLAGNSVAGEASWTGGAEGAHVSLALEGAEVNLTPLVDRGAGPAAIIRALGERFKGAQQDASAGAKGALARLAGIDAKLRIGKAVVGNVVLRDLTSDLRLAGGNLSMPMLRLGTEDGSTLELRGDVAGLMRGTARGAVTFSLAANGQSGLSELMDLAGVDAALRPDRDRAVALLPLKLAGRVRVGDSGAGIWDVSSDGSLAGNRVAGSLRLDPRGDGWRDFPIDLAANLEGSDAVRLGLQLLGSGGASSQAVAPAGRIAPAGAAPRVTLRGVGTAKGGVSSLVALDAPEAAAEFRGRAIVTDTATVAVEGDVRVTAPDAAAALALLGMRERPSLAGQMLSGVVTVSINGSQVRVTSPRVQVGSVATSGVLERDGGAEGGRLTGKLAVSEVSLPRLLALLTTARAGPKPLGGGGTSEVAWSEDGFDIGALASVETNIRIEATALTVAPGLSLGKSAIDVAARAGRLDLVLADGAALNGKATGALKLDRTPAGVRASLEVRLDGAKLEGAGADPASPAAKGPVAMRLEAESTAVSPRGLVAALKGKGDVRLGAGRLNRMAPGAVREAIAAFLAQKGEVPSGDLRRRLEVAIAGQGLGFGARAIGVEVGDGIVRLAPIVLEAPDGRITGTTAFDLDALRYDSEWRIELAGEPGAASSSAGAPAAVKVRSPLPPVSVVYAGPLGAMTAGEPKLQSEALEREVAVRKMERDVEELERLRRADEERARLEAARQETLRQEQLRLQQVEAERRRADELIREKGGVPPPTAPLPGNVPGALPVPAVAPAAPAPVGAPQPLQPSATPEAAAPQGAGGQAGNDGSPLPPASIPAPAGGLSDGAPAVKTGLGAETRPPPQPRPAQRPPATRDVFQKLDRSSP